MCDVLLWRLWNVSLQDGIQQEVYSRPLDCERRHETPHGVDVLTTSLELSKIVSNNTSLLACLVLINEENESIRPPVVSGCGTVQLPKINESEKYELESTETSISLLHASLNLNSDTLIIFFRVQVLEQLRDSCKLQLKVQNSDEVDNVLAQQTVSCSAQKFVFQQISSSISRQGFYEVCASIQSEEDGMFGADQVCLILVYLSMNLLYFASYHLDIEWFLIQDIIWTLAHIV